MIVSSPCSINDLDGWRFGLSSKCQQQVLWTDCHHCTKKGTYVNNVTLPVRMRSPSQRETRVRAKKRQSRLFQFLTLSIFFDGNAAWTVGIYHHII